MNTTTTTIPRSSARPGRLFARTATVGGLAVVGTVLLSTAAMAHHPEVTAAVACDGTSATVSYTSVAWTTSDPLARTNSSIGVRYSTNAGASFTALPVEAGHAFNAANGYAFSDSFSLAAPLPASIIVQVGALTTWGNGSSVGGSRQTLALPVPTCVVEEAPVDETPVDETPVDETPVDETPVDETPVDETPVDETPVDETPVDETPVDETPVDETPVDETPVDETPVDETPVDETPVDETPVDETPVDETPVDETPVDETPVDETPVDETPVDETPVDETPVDETPVDETPVDETPVDETPVDETPVLTLGSGTVAPPATPAVVQSSGGTTVLAERADLPFTGAPTGLLVLLGLTALGTGSVLLTAGRRTATATA